MKVQFKNSKKKDLNKLRDAELITRIKAIIIEVEKASSLEDVSNVKKLTAKGAYSRIRIGNYLGNYRICIVTDDDVIRFVRVLHRREIYRYFP